MIRRMIAAMALVAANSLPAQERLFNDDGYRTARYRAPVPAPPSGVVRISLPEAARLRPDRDALFIDVLPAEGGHRDQDGRWRLAVRPLTIPGAHWFPEAGRGEPDLVILAGFARGVARLSNRRRDRPIIVFCLSDCWMSWNAARRLHALGYRDVRWLAEGTDGWRDLGLPIEEAVPEGGLARVRTNG